MDRAKLEEAIERCKVAPVHYHPEKGLPPFWFTGQALEALREATEAHLATLPKPTKMVEVWRCEWVQYEIPKPFSQSEGSGEASKKWAEDHANYLRNYSCYSCIRVTGPHQQEVPA